MATVQALAARAGDELGVSHWIMVDQAMIDRFAEATGDHQFIHVDPERARGTPLGGTVAHGFLLLSLMPACMERIAGMVPDEVRMGLNYGGNRVRFLVPVRAGSRVRGRFRLLELVEKRPGQWQQTSEFTLEVENAAKPALIAEWITQLFV